VYVENLRLYWLRNTIVRPLYDMAIGSPMVFNSKNKSDEIVIQPSGKNEEVLMSCPLKE
jgi:hypothetical protein